MKSAYVTGATGCVGRNLVEELLKDDWTITVLHRKTSDLSRLDGCDVRFREVDLHNPESVHQALPEAADALFHAAGNTSFWRGHAERQWKDNVLATKNLVRTALDRGIGRLIFTSTGATLGFQYVDQFHLDWVPNNYIRTKLESEMAVYQGIEQGLDAVILQPIIILGPYDYNNYSTIFRNMKHRFSRVCFPGRIAFCHAGDVARAHVQAFEKGRRGEHYVLGGTYTTWFEAFQKICRRLDVPDPVVLPKPVLAVIARCMAAVSAVTGKEPLLTPDLVRLLKDSCDVVDYEKWKAREELGYESRDLDTMVEDCYQWLVQAGLL